MFKTRGTTFRTWHASIAHKRLVQQPVREEAAPDSPAAGFGTNAEIRHKSDYSQSRQPVTAKGDGAQRTPQVWQVMGTATSALGAAHAARIAPAPVRGTNLSPASPPTRQRHRPLAARKPHQVGNQNPHVDPNARFPTRTRHLLPQGLHPSWGAQQLPTPSWLKLSCKRRASQ